MNGKEALAAVTDENRFDVVLLDIIMPGKNSQNGNKGKQYTSYAVYIGETMPAISVKTVPLVSV